MRKVFVLLAFSLFLGTVVQGQLIPSMVNLPATPLRFVSITSSAKDYMEKVVVKNVSDREISSFQIGMLMAIPSPCSPTPDFGAEQSFQVDRIVVPVGGTATAHNYGLSPQTITSFDKSGTGRIVLSQIAVTSVTFTDGTSWQASRDGQMYDDSEVKQAAAKYCSASIASVDYQQLKSNCNKSPELQLAGFPIQSFNCVCGTGYGCQVSADDMSCTTSQCAGNQFCQNQQCHPVNMPVPSCGASAPSRSVSTAPFVAQSPKEELEVHRHIAQTARPKSTPPIN